MSDRASLGLQVFSGDKRVSVNINYTVDHVQNVIVTIPPATTDFEILIAIDVSKLRVLLMKTDVNITVETNNGTTPDNTFALTSLAPAFFKNGDAAILSADVTALYVTNAGADAALFELIAGVDL